MLYGRRVLMGIKGYLDSLAEGPQSQRQELLFEGRERSR